jgi:hypothetical protein
VKLLRHRPVLLGEEDSFIFCSFLPVGRKELADPLREI